MRRLWFKQRFVPEILEGRKVDTIRKGVVDWPPGTRIGASVGPRPPFAILEVTECTVITLSDLPADRRAKVAALYPDATTLTRVAFRVIATNAPQCDREVLPARA